MSSISSRTFEQAMADAANLLNDTAREVYTSAYLLPFAAQAHGEIQNVLSADGLQFAEKVSAAIAVAGGATTVSLATLTDFYAPIEIWERAAGAADWTLMERKRELPAPLAAAPAVFGSYEWANGTLRVPAAAGNREVLIRYESQAAYAAGGTAVGFENCYWPLVYGIATLAATPTGLDAEAKANGAKYIDSLKIAVAREKQKLEGVLRGPAPDRAAHTWLDSVRTLLMDTAKSKFADSFLLELAASVKEQIEAELRQHSIEFGETTAALAYVANAVTITGLPADLVEPLEVFQREAVGNEWTEVAKCDRLHPDPVSPPADLTFWEWSDLTLKVNAATVAQLIQVRYTKLYGYPTSANPSGFHTYYWPMVYGVAAEAAKRKEETQALAADLEGKYERAKWAVINISVKAQQGIPRGPKPYRNAGRRRRGCGY